jgi:hypothetical protein
MRRFRTVWAAGGLALVLSAGTAALATGPAYARDDAVPKNQPERGIVYDGLQRVPSSVCKAGLRVGRTKFCTHGPDPAPAGLNVRTRVAPAVKAGGRALAPQAALCEGDGTSGLRTQVVYARSSDVADRYAAYLDSFRVWAEGADAIYDASAAETGGSRHIRFVHDGSCVIDVANAVMPPAGDDNFDETMAALSALGYNRTDRKYMIFVDAFVYCGIGTFHWTADQPGPDSSNNGGPSYGRTDAGCWSASVAAHEHMHNIGGVQLSAPHTSGGGHCVDEWDLMCYSDWPNYPAMQVLCADGGHDVRFDCNHDDYYHTNPPAGSYLRTHWNAAESLYLTGGGQWGYVWADQPSADSYTPFSSYQRNSSGALNTITRYGVGQYTVQFTNLGAWGGTVDVTGYDSTGNRCKVGYWYPSGGHQFVDVRCFDQLGSPADSYFTAAFTRPVQNPGDIAFVWADQPTADSYTPSTTYQFNATGATNTVTRSGVGDYLVRMPGLGNLPAGHVKVTSYGTSDASTCKVGYWGESGSDRLVNVLCHDSWGFPVDTYYTVTYANAVSILGVTGAAAGYVWAHSPTSDSYEPTGTYSFNSTGGTNSITRNWTGNYTVRLPGLGRDDGHVQVTAYGGGSDRCKVGYWYASGSDLLVNVQCSTNTGTAVDTLFAASYTR